MNSKFKIFGITLHKYNYFEIDICKNVCKSTPSQSKYFTNIELKKSSYNKFYYAKHTGETINEFNIFNFDRFNDYHCNNAEMKLLDGGISISKLNLYNHLTNQLFSGLYGRSELYNKKFLHDALYLSNKLKLCANCKLANKQQVKVNESLMKNFKCYKNNKHYYRCEYKFTFNNELREFKKIDSYDMTIIFYHFKIFRKKNM